MQEAIKGLVCTGYFSCLDLKAGFWQIAMDEASKQYTTVAMGNMGLFECECMLKVGRFSQKQNLNFVERQAFASFKHDFFQVWGKC